MNTLGLVLEFVWTTLFTVALLAAVASVFVTAWTGKFWFGRSKNGKRWPPLRSEAPIRFWLVWMLYGGPTLLVPLLILWGVAASATES